MHDFLKNLIQLEEQEINDLSITECLNKIHFENIRPFINFLENSPSREYTRQLILQDFVSAYLMVWPPGGKSSIHEHKNFWGVIKLLKGNLMEREYDYSNHKLQLTGQKSFQPNDILLEETSAIHEIKNLSLEETAITLHVYYPANKNLSGCRLFDVTTGNIAILSQRSTSFSWNQPSQAFEKIENNQFSLQ